jgi:hypothetical protein
MGVYEYQGEPGLGYLRLPCAHGTVPITGLTAGDLVDFGEHEPPADGRWFEAPDGATATRLPDNHPDAQPFAQWPDPEPETEQQDSSPSDTIAADTAPATDAPKRTKAAKTTA